MDLKELEYTDFVLKSLIKDRPVVNIIFYKRDEWYFLIF